LINVTGPLTFTADNRRIYFRSTQGANTSRLVAFDPTNGETEVLAEDPHYDVVGVGFHPTTHEPQWVTFGKDRAEHLVLDPSVRDDFDALREVHPGDFSVTSRTRNDDRWLVAFTADDGPVAYYLWTRGTKKATKLFTSQPALEDYTLAKTEAFSFAAEDGLVVHGYITFPPNLPRENLPAVVEVHGGPWGARDAWGYAPTRQWLANRGYVCIQVNYRGSGGYGKDFLNASNREWAGKMHTDLIDGLQWAVDKGWVDPARVAIFGGSYGGYAALVGATFTPDTFACAVDIVGPSNLVTLLESIPPYWVGVATQFHKLLGHPERDRDFLMSRSPISKVDQIRIPMLIGQGANDPRVKQAESEQIVAAMKERGIDHEYLLFEDEGHGFARPENRDTFYRAAERFLAKHIGGRSED
jgi:dipeptidyl aminopeptidase/acylaminoacyl peptidase